MSNGGFNLKVQHIISTKTAISGAFSFTPWLQPGDLECSIKPGNRLNGFRSLGSIATWLKPGVNKTGMLITGSQLTTMLHFKLESTNDKWKIWSLLRGKDYKAS